MSGDPSSIPGLEPPPPEPHRPTPLSIGRVADLLAAEGYAFDAAKDESLTGTWNSHMFVFAVVGPRREIFHVRARWSHALGAESRSAALQACNDWNRDHLWPKTYIQEDDGTVAACAAVSVDFEHGATDRQLAALCESALATCLQFFAALDTLLGPGGDTLGGPLAEPGN